MRAFTKTDLLSRSKTKIYHQRKDNFLHLFSKRARETNTKLSPFGYSDANISRGEASSTDVQDISI